jgi:Potential Queuosine, Q, salvage protein family
MSLGVLNRVRAAAQEVAARASYVRIDESSIPAYVAALPIEQASSPKLDPRHHYLGDPREIVAYILTLDAINFGSGYFPYLQKRPRLSGYFTIATCLKERFEIRGAFKARELCRLTLEDCADIFGQNLTKEPIRELMGLFASALNELGRHLLDRYEGDFVGLVNSAESSAERLVELLAKMPYFQDIQKYSDVEVPFYKRAQLTAADLSIALGNQGFGFFNDLPQLTIFADNLIPHVLRVDGILQYEQNLAAKIDAEELISAGTDEEIEIRACAIHAAELIVAELRRLGHKVSALKLDYLLWNRGQQPEYKSRPRHRTRTIFY